MFHVSKWPSDDGWRKLLQNDYSSVLTFLSILVTVPWSLRPVKVDSVSLIIQQSVMKSRWPRGYCRHKHRMATGNVNAPVSTDSFNDHCIVKWQKIEFKQWRLARGDFWQISMFLQLCVGGDTVRVGVVLPKIAGKANWKM